MIHQWEVFHYPVDFDPNRYRLSLWADGPDVAKIRDLYPGRAGALWIPKRKPFNAAFFLYKFSAHEKDELEQILSGKIPLPEKSASFIPSQPLNKKLTHEDTQEVLLMDVIAKEGEDVSSGLGKPSSKTRSIKIGYFVPSYFSVAGDRVHSILENTLVEKKVSVEFKKDFILPYQSLSLSEIRQLIEKCQRHRITHVVAIGEPSNMRALLQFGRKNGILIKPLSESVVDKNLWLTVVAEILSFEPEDDF